MSIFDDEQWWKAHQRFIDTPWCNRNEEPPKKIKVFGREDLWDLEDVYES